MALIPITQDTSFRDISIYMEWWILFGIIIIANSKSPIDSALKCFVFFLISQPLIYLVQVPFSSMGFGLFKYYKYWFGWTLATLPMGFIGYYIKKKNWLSVLILLPMLYLLTYFGLGYLSSVMNDFPHHLLSFISCFLIIIAIVWGLFDKTKFKIACLSFVVILIALYSFISSGITNSKYETVRSLDDFNIEYVGKIEVSFYKGEAQGKVELIKSTGDYHTIKLSGLKSAKYEFSIIDESNKEYNFEYYYNNKEKAVVLKLKK